MAASAGIYAGVMYALHSCQRGTIRPGKLHLLSLGLERSYDSRFARAMQAQYREGIRMLAVGKLLERSRICARGKVRARHRVRAHTVRRPWTS